ncbi:MAG: sulfite exporter TauE/SafE family protein [Ectothiorhodospiraceae bacterium]|nr:sulfite exporter TauE/SafE family protein [Ectothiorhodospiraceae bacterium]
MEPSIVAFAACVVFGAYLVRGIAGFGSGLISIPLLALVLPLPLVVPVVVLLDYVGSATQGLHNRRAVSWGDLAPLLPFTLIGVLVALLTLDAVEPRLLTRSLGVFVIVYAVYQLLPVPELRGSRISSIPYGLLGGLVGTLFGTGGPFYVIYLTLRGLDRVAFRASFATWFLVDGSIRLVGYLTFGMFDREALVLTGAALPIALAALWVGGRLQTGMSPTTFKRLISVLLLGSGTALLLKSWT